ncbi:hypothetical protein AB4P93_00255 (plasmid) [Pseudomonas sp. B26140]|uniref:hypothetical protein n=1 Tax=Pseudomonas sp. B26140 TaxID=3235112 RepID=UPI0037842809
MELIDKQVTLFVGDAVKAHFPHIESVVVDFVLPAEPVSQMSTPASCAGVAEVRELAAGEIASFDVPPRIEIGVINITGNASDSGAYLREIVEFLKAKGF